LLGLQERLGHPIVVKDRGGGDLLGEQRIAAVDDQVQVKRIVRLLLPSPLTSMVMVFVVSPGLKVNVPE